MTMPSDREIKGDLSQALQEAQKGDQTAWETLFRECYPKVRRVVRRRLDSSIEVALRLHGYRQRRDEEPGRELEPSQLSVDRFADCVPGSCRRTEGDRRVSQAAHAQARQDARTPIDLGRLGDRSDSASLRRSPRPVSGLRPRRCESGCWTGLTRPSGRSSTSRRRVIRSPTSPTRQGGTSAKFSGFSKNLHDALHESGE